MSFPKFLSGIQLQNQLQEVQKIKILHGLLFWIPASAGMTHGGLTSPVGWARTCAHAEMYGDVVKCSFGLFGRC